MFRKFLIFFLERLLVLTYSAFKVETLELNILKKRINIFYSEAPFLIILGHAFSVLLINIFSFLTNLKLFVQLSDDKKNDWVKKNVFRNFSLFKLSLKSVSSLGNILNSKNQLSKKLNLKNDFFHFIDFNHTNDVYDFIVVGSGAGGSTAAFTLAENGKKTLLIEEGENFNPNKVEVNTFESLRSLWRNFGMQVCYGSSIIPIIQGRVLGGSTLISGSIIHPFQKKVWDQWCKLDLGINKFLNFKKILQSGNEILKIINFSKGNDAIYKNTMLWKVLEKSGFKLNAMDRSENGCKGSENCLIGCRTGGKSSVDRTLISHFQKHDGKILLKTKLISFKKENNLISLKVIKGPNAKKINCKKLILSCGVIETAKILKKSGFKNKYLGKGFSCNISSSIAVEYKQKKEEIEGPPMGVEALYNDIKFSTQSLPIELSVARLNVMPNDIKNINLNYLSTWAISIPSSSIGKINFGITNSLLKVNFSPNKFDMIKLRKATIHLIKSLRKIKNAIIYPQIESSPNVIFSNDKFDESIISSLNPSSYPLGISHIFGGCCISSKKNHGVLNPNGEVKGIKDVYVLDASILPLPTGINPQFSIMSIVRFLTKKLLNEN